MEVAVAAAAAAADVRRRRSSSSSSATHTLLPLRLTLLPVVLLVSTGPASSTDTISVVVPSSSSSSSSSSSAEESLLSRVTAAAAAAASSSSSATESASSSSSSSEEEEEGRQAQQEQTTAAATTTTTVKTKYGHNYNGSPSGLGSQVVEDGCGVYLALSTLPGTGLGMFAGRSFRQDEVLMSGDHNIPIVDMEDYHPSTAAGSGDDRSFFLWDSYTWNSDAVSMDHLGKYEVSVASPGFGAAANSFMDFVNVEEWLPEEGIGGYHHHYHYHGLNEGRRWDPDADLHRSKDPGAGASTNYHSRSATASRPIDAGQELFVSYGNSWFKDRASWLGPVPVKGDHKRAETLLNSFYANLVDKKHEPENKNNSNSNSSSNSSSNSNDEILNDFYDTLVVGLNDGIWSSRTIAALPSNASDARTVVSRYGGNVRDWKEFTMKRSVDFLRSTGVCVDNLYLDRSTFRQAGHGAFAARPMRRDDVVLPVPLIHIPDRSLLDVYGWTSKRDDGKYGTVDFGRGPTGKQLLMNYVLGHPDSTMLLSPYGPAFNYVNHNQTLANVKIRWADPLRSNHHPELLNKSVGAFHDIKFSGLAFELVALRDIAKDEEVFLDYGDEWERAWEEHVRNWRPVDGAGQYKSASQMNKSPTRLKTVFEELTDPYPSNLVLQINKAFLPLNGYDGDGDDFTPRDVTYAEMTEEGTIPCDILRYEVVEDGLEMDNVDDPRPGHHYYYTVAVRRKKRGGVEQDMVYSKIPRRAFKFWDNEEMSMDFYLPNAFRHPLGIPDEIMPEAWKNLKH